MTVSVRYIPYIQLAIGLYWSREYRSHRACIWRACYDPVCGHLSRDVIMTTTDIMATSGAVHVKPPTAMDGLIMGNTGSIGYTAWNHSVY